jgi:hypothetical protein
MIYIFLTILSLYILSVFNESLFKCAKNNVYLPDNCQKITSPKVYICGSAKTPNYDIDFKKYYNIISKFIKSLNFKKKFDELKTIFAISIGIHLIGIVILCFINVKQAPIKQNWTVQFDPSEEEVQEIQVIESAPPMESAPDDEVAEGGNDNPTDNFSKNIPIPEISDQIIIAENSSYRPPFNVKTKTHLAKVDFGSFVAGNSRGEGNGYGFGKGNGRGGNGKGKILGDEIISSKLGVILDVSPSMMIHISSLKEDINKNFKNPDYHEVQGCAIRTTSITVYAIEQLAKSNVDAIYWFCDLQDSEDPRGIDKIKNILKNKNIRLYVKSLDFPPTPELKSVIDETGGRIFN